MHFKYTSKVCLSTPSNLPVVDTVTRIYLLVLFESYSLCSDNTGCRRACPNRVATNVTLCRPAVSYVMKNNNAYRKR